jgi:hypothetical protein
MINVYGNENKYDLKKVDIFQVIISKSEHLWWKNNNYTKKVLIKRLSQTTYDFFSI